MGKIITKDWPIAKLLAEYPDSASLLMEMGFPCVGCALAQFETIEQGAIATHGLDDAYLDKLLVKLNELAEKQSTTNNESED